MRHKIIVSFIGFTFCLAFAGCTRNQPAVISDQSTPGSGASSESNIGAPAETPEVEVSPTDEPAPTDEPTPVPSPTMLPTATPDPTADFVPFESPTGGFRFGHPDDWAASDLAGLAMVASSAELLEEPEPGDEGGIIVITSGPTAEMEEEFDSRDPVAIISEGFQELAFGQDVTLVDGPQAETINGRDAATATLALTSDDGRPLSAYLALIVADPYSVVAFGAAPQADAASYLETFAAISRTIETFEPVVDDSLNSTVLDAESEGTLFNGDAVQEKLAPGERSVWTFIGLSGERFDIALTTLVEETNLTMDVVDEFGNSIVETPPEEILGKLTILGLEIQSAGTYYIIISGAEEGDGGGYELVFSNSEGGASDSDPDGSAITYGQVYLGTIENEEDVVSLPFIGQEGDIALLLVEVDLDLDVWVDFQDVDGNSLVLYGNDNSDYYEVVAARLPADGDYVIVVSSIFGTGNFDVLLEGPAGSMISSTADLDPEGDEDVYPFTAEQDDLVFMSVEPETDYIFDMALYDALTDEEIYGLVYNDRAFGEKIPLGGDYYFQVNTLDEDGDGQADGSGAYDFAIFGPASTQFELAVGDRVQGKFGGPDGHIDYLYSGRAGNTIVLTLDAAGEGDGVLRIRDIDGNILAEVDEAFTGPETLTYTFEDDGLVIIRAEDFFAGSDAFDLTVTSE